MQDYSMTDNFNSESNQTFPSDYILFEFLSVPGPVNAFSVIRRGATHFELAWDKPMTVNGVLIGYSVAYQGT